MKLTGAAISPALLISRIGERLRARGLVPRSQQQELDEAPETPVDPWLGFLEQLWGNAEPAEPLPYNPGDSQVKRLVSQALRLPLQPVLDDLFGAQRRFNRSATESYAHLAAELKKLRAEVVRLRAQIATLEATQRDGYPLEVSTAEDPSIDAVRESRSAAKTTPSKKAPAKKAPAKKAPAKKAPAKKAPVKKARGRSPSSNGASAKKSPRGN